MIALVGLESSTWLQQAKEDATGGITSYRANRLVGREDSIAVINESSMTQIFESLGGWNNPEQVQSGL